MRKIINMSKEDKRFIFDTASLKMKIHPAIIEKDFWVCYILDYLFYTSKYKDYFTFKGGTSLSKAYNVISRMSEDIDLILDWQLLGAKIYEPLEDRSKRQQEIYNEKLNNLAKNFIASELYEDLLNGFRDIPEFKIEVVKEEQLVNIYYPKTYDTDNIGILPCVRLEIGPLAAWTPASIMEINPYICGVIPNFVVSGTKVRTVDIERTFWEKITILHREANRPESKKMPKRYARHYYDVYQIFKSKYFNRILTSKQILEKVTKFKIKFYNDNWAKYDDVLNGNIKILPPNFRLEELIEDYNSMKEMINGEAPNFNNIIISLKELEKILKNEIKESIDKKRIKKFVKKNFVEA